MTRPRILVRGPAPLPCSVKEFKYAVFVEVEGIGDVTSAKVGPKDWTLEVEFESPHSFVGVIDAVRVALTRLDFDLFAVNVRVRRSTYRLVDLF